MTTRAARCAAALTMTLVALASTGCQTERVITNNARTMPPKPVRAPAVPADAKANRLALIVGAKPRDTNGNGYPDLIDATTMLFALPYESPIYEDGAFVFSLHALGPPGTEPSSAFATWRIAGDELEQSQVVSAFFRSYRFRLSLLEAGGDRIPLMRADLRCRFEPADGRAAIEPIDDHVIQIGRELARGRP